MSTGKVVRQIKDLGLEYTKLEKYKKKPRTVENDKIIKKIKNKIESICQAVIQDINT